MRKHLLYNDALSSIFLWLLVFLMWWGLGGCAAHRAKICAQCPVVSKDSITTNNTVTVRDTTIYLTIPGPVQYLENPCKDLCDSLGRLRHFDFVKKDHGIVSEIKSIGNSIEFDCKADSLKAVITLLQHNRSSVEKRIDTKTIEVNKLTKLQGFWIISSYGFWIFFAIQILVKVLSTIYPITKPFIYWLYWMRF